MESRRSSKPDASTTISFRQLQVDDSMIDVWTSQIQKHLNAKTERAKRALCTAYCSRGVLYRELEKFDLAIADFTAALKVFPQHREALLQLGKYPAFHSGDLNEARDFIRVQIAYHFRSSDLYSSMYQSQSTLVTYHLNYGLVMQQQGDHHEALIAFDDASKVCLPDLPGRERMQQSIRLARAKSLLSQGRLTNSIREFRIDELLDADADFAFFHAYLASLAESDAVAEQLLNYVISQTQSQPWAMFLRGKLYEKKNQQALAVADYQRGWLIGKAMSGGSLYCLLQLHRLQQLPEDVDLFTQAKKFAECRQQCADDLCVLIMVLAAANQFTHVKDLMACLWKDFLPQAVSHHLQADFLRLLINPDCRPMQDLSIINGWWAECKDQLTEMITSQQNRELSLNVALHALSQYSLVGSVMHHKRIGTTPSITTGRLQKIALYLNEHTDEIANLPLYPATRDVLANEAKLNPAFVETLQKSYPALFAVLKPVLNLRPQIIARSSGYGFMQRMFGRVDIVQPTIQDEAGNRFVREL